MRFTSAIWFAIFLRKETARGAFVTVVKQGAQQAGAIFVIQNNLDGSFNLYGPAPQVFFDTEEVADRVFEKVLEKEDQTTIDIYIEKQINFDPDLWVVETESGAGEVSLEIIES